MQYNRARQAAITQEITEVLRRRESAEEQEEVRKTYE